MYIESLPVGLKTKIVIEGGYIQGDWMKVIYRLEHGRKLYSCYIYEKEAWFGLIKERKGGTDERRKNL